MIIVDEQTEEKFLHHLEEVRNETGWRCIHLHTALLDYENRRSKAVDFVNRISSGTDYLYLNDGGDVFLLGRDYAVRDVRRAASWLNDEVRNSVIDPAADYYENGSDWNRLIYLADERVKVLRRRAEAILLEHKKRQQEEEKQATLHVPVDPALLSSVGDRRSKHQRPIILVVEDEPFSARLVEGALTTKSANGVVLAHDGRSAILSYARHAPHVVFLDIELPDVSGHDILKRLLQIDPSAYIVMLSGNCDKDHVLRAMQAGAQGFVGKPFTRDKLNQYIDRCAGVKRLRTGEGAS